MLISVCASVLFVSAIFAETDATTTTHATITIGSKNYSVTKKTKTIASGVKYITLAIPDKKVSGYSKGTRVHVLEADLTDPTVTIKHGDSGRDSRRNLSTQAANLSTSTATVVGGVNANFWITSETPYKDKLMYEPFGLSVKTGVMYSDLNTNTAKHCQGPTKTGAMVIDGNGKCYIDYLKSQKDLNAAGSGWNFNLMNTTKKDTMALDQVNGVSCPDVASVYIKSVYGATKKFRPVTGKSDYSTYSGTDNTIVYLKFATSGETKWKCSTQKFTVKKISKDVSASTLTITDSYDVAIVCRGKMATIAKTWATGDAITVTAKVNFKTQGSPRSMHQGVSGNCICMANGVIGYNSKQENYNSKIYPRTLYATNDAGTKLWLIVVEHYPNQQSTYSGLNTTDATYVAKFLGATWAMQVDCGGSSQMYAGTKQVSDSYDKGGVRAVQSGVFILSTPTAATTRAILSANKTNVSLTAEQNATAPYVDVKITGKNLSTDLTYSASSDAVKVTTLSGWNAKTGGTLRVTLNTALSAASRKGSVTVASGSKKIDFYYTAKLTASTTSTPDSTPTTGIKTSTTEITLKAKHNETPAPYVDVQVTGTNLTSDISCNSFTGKLIPTQLEGWDNKKGGTLRITLDTSSDPGEYSSFVAVQSATAYRVEINATISITEDGTSADTPIEPEPEIPVWNFDAAPTLTKVWETSNLLPVSSARFATGSEGKVYAVDKTTATLYSWDAEGCDKTEVITGFGGSFACIADDGGNILTSKAGKAADTWQVYNIDSKQIKDIAVTAPTGVTDGLVYANAAAVGNVLSAEGGTIYMAPHTKNVAAKIVVKGGVQDASSCAAATYADGTFSVEHQLAVANVDYSALGAESFIWRDRRSTTNYISGGALKIYTEPSNTIPVTGFATFKLNNIEYGVIPTGTAKDKYSDGFSVFNLADGAVIASRAQTNTVSDNQYGSLRAEKVSEGEVNIYFYKSGLACGMYKFAYPVRESPSTSTDIAQSQVEVLRCYVDDNMLCVEGIEAQQISLYSMTGQCVVSVLRSNQVGLIPHQGVFLVKIVDKQGNIYTDKIVLK